MPKTNLAQLGVKGEATPGSAESLSASDVAVRLRSGYAFEPDYELIETEEIQEVSSKRPAVIGRRAIRFTGEYILKGPGSVSQDPDIAEMLASALFVYGNAMKIGIGAVTSGPFLVGETVTGGTSGASAQVIAHCADGDSYLYYAPVSGTLESAETLTGGTSGASATSSGSPTREGTFFKPIDPADGVAGYHASVVGNRDGFYFQGRGCLSDLAINFENGQPAIVTQNWHGALHSKGDQALWDVTYPGDSIVVPKFLAANCYIGSFQPTGLIRLDLNFPTNPTIIADANSSAGDGILRADYNRGLPTITAEFDQTAASAFDLFSSLDTGTTLLLRFQLGSSAGNIWTFSAPAAQIRPPSLGEADPNRATFQVEFGLTGTANDELFIWAH